MAIEKKRMQQRQGTYDQFMAHKDEFLPCEFEVVTSGDPNTSDGKSLHFAFNPGETKRLMTAEDAQGEMDAAVEEATRIATEAAESAQQSAEQAKEYFDQIPEKVEESKQAIADYTEAIKQTIPEDYTTLSELVDELDRTRAPGIVCTTTGEQISIDNASDQKFRGLKVYGKGEQVKTTGAQLAPITESEYTGNGMTANLQEDGSLIINGNPSGAFVACVNIVMPKLETGSYYISGGESGAGKAIAQIYLKKPTGDLYYSNQSFQIDGQETEIFFQVLSNDTSQINNYRINAILNKGSSALPIEPYTGGQPAPSPAYPQEIHMPGESGSMNVNVTGNQLFDASKLPTKSEGGATVTNNGDGSFTISGSGNMDGYFLVEHNLSTEETKRILRSGEITLKCEKTTRPHFIVKIISETNELTEELNNYEKETATLNIDESWLLYEDIKMQYLFFESEGIKISEGIIKPMLYQSGNGTWEPFKEPQTLPISTPNGLPGIPVTSDGNYTDRKGQQWISDVLDFDRGKWVHNVDTHIFNGSEDEGWYTEDQQDENRATRFISTYTKSRILIPKDNETIASMICSMYKVLKANDTYVKRVGVSIQGASGDNGSMYVYDPRFENTEQYKTWLKENPFTLVYAVKKPYETDIPAEEMAAYNTLRTNYPNTNVFSDQEVEPGMEVKYTADTKIYVDKKIAEAVTQAITIAKA